MKLDLRTWGLLLLVSTLVLLGSAPRSLGETVSNFGTYSASPAHPKTWIDGATCTRKQLRWDSVHHLLVVDVSYSNQDYADATNPTRQDDFIMPFPDVRLNADHKFIVKGSVIATLRGAFLGQRVVLEPGVDLSVHRHQGIIHAALIRFDREK